MDTSLRVFSFHVDYNIVYKSEWSLLFFFFLIRNYRIEGAGISRNKNKWILLENFYSYSMQHLTILNTKNLLISLIFIDV